MDDAAIRVSGEHDTSHRIVEVDYQGKTHVFLEVTRMGSQSLALSKIGEFDIVPTAKPPTTP